MPEKGFLWPVLSSKKTESKKWMRENPYSGIFYAVNILMLKKEIKKYRKKYRDSHQRLFCEKTTQKNQECLQKSQENVCDGVFFLSQIAVFGP